MSTIILLFIFLLFNFSVPQKIEEQIDVFTKGEAGYMCIRIPSILQTKDSLNFIAFAEGRALHSGNVNCCIAPVQDFPYCVDKTIVYKRSIDGGKTWSKLAPFEFPDGTFQSNPVPVYDEKTGEIILIISSCRKSYYACEFLVYRSKDYGATWSSPQPLFPNATLGYGLAGPPSGLQMKSGRLAWPMDTGNPNKMVYSDNDGLTLATKTILSVGECYGESQITEVQKNSLVFTARNPGRCFAYSDDGGNTWYGAHIPTTLPSVNCEGSVTYHAGNDTLLFSGPAVAPNGFRAKETLFSSKDNGKTWSSTLLIWEGPSSYSSLIDLSGNTVGIFYERGYDPTYPFEHLTFAIISF
eukprot:TRINITY_DN13612_c0_g1_i1.p1 TRINITY_DN13612_c0_g1~~TRINITY_DN13612_c0_g1_i1.p1  ORF type:complete len:354 (+),score=53.37 TRINITY_DN13612_c0_g1_i1:50-1111(+)